ncbi:MAG TPA: hypothetical protein VM118_14075 [Acidobacteriota bacterium]|nr:hypothetical protein [Acidobacteriota bacterium]
MRMSISCASWAVIPLVVLASVPIQASAQGTFLEGHQSGICAQASVTFQDAHTYGIGAHGGYSFHRLFDVSAGMSVARRHKANSSSVDAELDFYPTRGMTAASAISPFLIAGFGLMDGSDIAAPSDLRYSARKDGMVTYWAYGGGLTVVVSNPRDLITTFTVAYFQVSVEPPFKYYDDRLVNDAVSVASSLGRRDKKGRVTYGQVGLLFSDNGTMITLALGATMPIEHGR